MSLRIQNNIEAFNAHRQLAGTGEKISKSMQKLSSGYRINNAADDAAGLAISERLKSQIGGLDQAQRNAQDAVSLVQTAEGSLDQVHAMLQRIRDLAVEYKNGTLSTTDQQSIQSEVNQLASEIERIGASATFNGISLLSNATTLNFQVGSNDGQDVALAAQKLLIALDLPAELVEFLENFVALQGGQLPELQAHNRFRLGLGHVIAVQSA